MGNPAELKYTAEHEWVRADGDTLTVGITAYAADKLGEVVYVELPTVGADVSAGSVISEVESTKSVGEVYAPVSGEIVAVNDELGENPELINDEPFGGGWLFAVKVTDPGVLASAEFLDAEAYAALTED